LAVISLEVMNAFPNCEVPTAATASSQTRARAQLDTGRAEPFLPAGGANQAKE
jgi:hypothetical protein